MMERPKGNNADEWCAWFFEKAGYGASFLGVQIAEAIDEHMERSALLDRSQAVRMLLLQDGEHAVCVGGRWDGWLMWRHPDGHWVTISKLSQADAPFKSVPIEHKLPGHTETMTGLNSLTIRPTHSNGVRRSE